MENTFLGARTKAVEHSGSYSYNSGRSSWWPVPQGSSGGGENISDSECVLEEPIEFVNGFIPESKTVFITGKSPNRLDGCLIRFYLYSRCHKLT